MPRGNLYVVKDEEGYILFYGTRKECLEYVNDPTRKGLLTISNYM